MTEKELKRLSRADLLEMLIAQSEELQKARDRLAYLEKQASSRKIAIDNAGSIAEAALHLNGIFEKAEESCAMYLENIRTLSDRQEEVCRQREEEAARKADEILKEAELRCAAMEKEAKEKYDSMMERYGMIRPVVSKEPQGEKNESDFAEDEPDGEGRFSKWKMKWRKHGEEEDDT